MKLLVLKDISSIIGKIWHLKIRIVYYRFSWSYIMTDTWHLYEKYITARIFTILPYKFILVYTIVITLKNTHIIHSHYDVVTFSNFESNQYRLHSSLSTFPCCDFLDLYFAIFFLLFFIGKTIISPELSFR